MNKLDQRIDKVGAGAAALAAFHSFEFDPDYKLNVSAGVGNYGGATAAALGLFYRPNDTTMLSLGATVGNDQNMVNAGITVKVGQGSGQPYMSKAEMARQIEELKAKDEAREAQMAKILEELQALKKA